VGSLIAYFLCDNDSIAPHALCSEQRFIGAINERHHSIAWKILCYTKTTRQKSIRT